MFNVSFTGKREDKNAVDQLRKSGSALTLNNQRNINEAIKNMSNDGSEENIKFLMNVAQGLRYGTSFELGDKKTNNDWKGKLQAATQKAIDNSDSPNKEALKAQFKQVFVDKKQPTQDEQEVLKLRNDLLKTKGLPQAINSSKNDVVKNIAKNLDYFVISTEITTEEKKACLEKLNKMMSPSYKINPQLKDKKPQVLGELLNDLVVKTAESDKPIIKTTDQRHHGMCAAISTSRKTIAYEYKDKYVTMIMEELNNKPEMKVYDPSKLGTGKKVAVQKTEIDFDYADDKGYRILDASALQWMNIAGTSGDGKTQSTHFSAFDKKYFDTFHDGHYMRDFDDPKLVPHQYHLRALEKAEDFIGATKRGIEKREKDAVEQRQNARFDAQTVVKANKSLNAELSALMPQKSSDEMLGVVNRFLKMGEVKGAQSDDMHFHDYEEESMKKQKMANFIKAENPNVKSEDINKRMENIFNMYELSTETTEAMNKEILPKSPEAKMKKLYKPLWEAAAAYRTVQDKKLDIPEELDKAKKETGLGKDATKADVMKKFEESGKVVSEKVLSSMQDKYNKIAKYAAVVEKAEVKGEKLDMPNLYEMTDEEKSTLDKVGKNINKMYSEIKRDTKAKQKELEQPLNELAKQVGHEKGNFWVNKEGSSGLNTPQEIRILEQMTGVPYYAEESVEVAAEKIKREAHSGISGTSVYHNDTGGHAMYIADVAPLLVKDPKTGKVEVKDAIMHDNTWGACEHKKTWLDSKGLLRTDYQCGRGGENGYITNAAWQNGTLVEDFKYKAGQFKDGEKFKMFFDAILQTDKHMAKSPATQLVQTVFVGPQIKMSSVASVLEALKKVPAEHLDKIMERSENAGETAEATTTAVYKDLEKINSEADVKKASPMTQKYLAQVAEQMTFNRESAMGAITQALATVDLKADAIDKDFDDNFAVLRKFVDAKYDPASNEAFVAKFNELKAMSPEDLAKELETATDEQLSVKEITPYEVARQVKGLEKGTESALKNAIYMDSLQDNIKFTENGDSFEEAYFMLQRDWNSLNFTKDINNIKASFFNKHGVRPAFPEPQMVTKEETAELAKNFTDTLKQGAEVVGVINQMLAGKLDKQGMSDADLKLALKNQLADIKSGKKTFIDANVEPRYRNRAMQDLDAFLGDAIKGKDSSKSFAKFEENFSKHHILNNPKETLKEFLRLSKSEDPAKQEMAKTYEGYMVKGCYELAKFEMEYSMMSTAGDGHMHEVGQELKNIKVPAEWSDDQKTSYNLGTDKGLYAFMEKSLETGGVDNTLAFLNHTGMNKKAMSLEFKNTNFDEIKAAITPETLMQVVEIVETRANFVEGLKLDANSKEAKMRDEYMTKMNDLIEYINTNAPAMLAQMQQAQA